MLDRSYRSLESASRSGKLIFKNIKYCIITSFFVPLCEDTSTTFLRHTSTGKPKIAQHSKKSEIIMLTVLVYS